MNLSPFPVISRSWYGVTKSIKVDKRYKGGANRVTKVVIAKMRVPLFRECHRERIDKMEWIEDQDQDQEPLQRAVASSYERCCLFGPFSWYFKRLAWKKTSRAKRLKFTRSNDHVYCHDIARLLKLYIGGETLDCGKFTFKRCSSAHRTLEVPGYNILCLK